MVARRSAASVTGTRGAAGGALQRLDKPRTGGPTPDLQRCLRRKDTAAFWRKFSARAHDATSVTKQVREVIAVSLTAKRRTKRQENAERSEAINVSAWENFLGERNSNRCALEYGNVVNHNDLFSGEYANLPGYTPDRRWLISEFIFNERINFLTAVRPPALMDCESAHVERNRVAFTNC